MPLIDPLPQTPMPSEPPNWRSRWLSRLSFSFFIIAGWLAWEAYKLYALARQDGITPPMGRITLYLIAAVLSFAMGGAGVKERHRRGE